MVGERTSLNDLHRLELFETSLLCDLVLALVSIVLEVAYIGDIAYITYLVAKMTKELYEYIISHTRTSMSKMCVSVYCRAADIQSYMTFVDRLENLFLS
jgi:hypothetical protein